VEAMRRTNQFYCGRPVVLVHKSFFGDSKKLWADVGNDIFMTRSGWYKYLSWSYNGYVKLTKKRKRRP
jgi:hypothetical protein